MTYLDEMITKATLAHKNAYAPYSHCAVGCAIKTIDHQFFLGCNVENAAYASTQCAEASAIGAMVVAGGRKISDVLIISTEKYICYPCGNCRQVIYEFGSLQTQIHVCQLEKGLYQTLALSELLPYAFTLPKN